MFIKFKHFQNSNVNEVHVSDKTAVKENNELKS